MKSMLKLCLKMPTLGHGLHIFVTNALLLALPFALLKFSIMNYPVPLVVFDRKHQATKKKEV
ncbi:hypothetical protein CE91St24_26660 [Odoribacteraceae bacterium]|jgi:hypothetical protein|nr:hypothetical protein CE91St21_03900 [Odoribacteraceae bacterium]GKH91894.1 hypothetical protein CE91St23_03900 [Odoribacteraceae bacterium]GKH96512.1 hypothetical protein CE91St22_03900 [Odoribacteraceae bacterium]GKI03391.1 hypothetical protein CE91St24_26660 [Odoribacteraceae bacterium]